MGAQDCKPGFVFGPHHPGGTGDDHSSRPAVAGRFKQSYPGAGKAAIAPLFDLAPGRVCRAPSVTSRAVGSYPTVSPLPRGCPRGGLFSVALSVSRSSRHGCLAVSQYLCFRSPDFPPAHPLAGVRQRSSVLRLWRCSYPSWRDPAITCWGELSSRVLRPSPSIQPAIVPRKNRSLSRCPSSITAMPARAARSASW